MPSLNYKVFTYFEASSPAIAPSDTAVITWRSVLCRISPAAKTPFCEVVIFSSVRIKPFASHSTLSFTSSLDALTPTATKSASVAIALSLPQRFFTVIFSTLSLPSTFITLLSITNSTLSNFLSFSTKRGDARKVSRR